MAKVGEFMKSNLGKDSLRRENPYGVGGSIRKSRSPWVRNTHDSATFCVRA